jgi:hypothetical protein
MARSCGSVHIVEYKHAQDPSPHIEFVIEYKQTAIEECETSVYRTTHRYTDFVLLHQLLRPTIATLPAAFPVRKQIIHTDAVKLDQSQTLATATKCLSP